jgi:ZIP family zinc transporter
MLAFSAGAMAFSSVEMLSQSHRMGGDVMVVAGFLLGFLALMGAEKLLPHVHMHLRKKELDKSKKKAALIAGTITLHNVPEGFAIATAFAASNPLGWFVTTSIALQDIPEGVLVSTPLACYGIGVKKSVIYGMFSGFIEGVAAIAGYLFLSSFAALVPPALAFSAGAMVYVIFVEVLPDALEGGMERVAALSFAAGAAMTFGLASLLAI